MPETYSYDNLLAGCQKDVVQRPAEFRVYESLVRGQICGRLTATGLWQKLAFASLASFSEIGITVEAVDTTDGTQRKTTVYVEGEFNEDHVTFDYGNTASDWRETLAGYGIYLRAPVATDGTY